MRKSKNLLNQFLHLYQEKMRKRGIVENKIALCSVKEQGHENAPVKVPKEYIES